MTLPIVRKRSNKSNTKRIVACACSSGLRLIVRHHVDDHDRLATPSKLKGAVNQRVLQSRRPLMPFDLLNSRLPNVGDREACAMLLVDFSGTMPPRRGTKSASLIGCLLNKRGVPKLSQSHLSQQHHDTALSLPLQRLPNRRRRIFAHRAIRNVTLRNRLREKGASKCHSRILCRVQGHAIPSVMTTDSL